MCKEERRGILCCVGVLAFPCVFVGVLLVAVLPTTPLTKTVSACTIEDLNIVPAGCVSNCSCSSVVYSNNYKKKHVHLIHSGACSIGVVREAECCITEQEGDLLNISLDISWCEAPSAWQQYRGDYIVGAVLICVMPFVALVLCVGWRTADCYEAHRSRYEELRQLIITPTPIRDTISGLLELEAAPENDA